MNKVVVLIPHYNNPKGLIKSLRSIVSTEKIDVVIVDDGSLSNKINETVIHNSFLANGKISFLYLEINQGIEYALNHGLNFILDLKKHQFIARLDCGDICIGKRFQIQQVFLTRNPTIKFIGSNAIAVNTEGEILYKSNYPLKSKDIEKRMYLNAMFIHPSIMFDIAIIPIVGKYPLNYKAAEDYAFFFKIINNFQTANLQEFLVQYEINPSGISFSKRKLQVWSRIRIIKDNFYFGFWPIYGLSRNILLYILPNSLIQKIKFKIK
jgi:glycosyltransferase involved in cell wall biosynthesis